MDQLSTSLPNVCEFSLSFDELEHNPADVLTILGYADGDAPEYLLQIYDDIRASAASHCIIRGGYKHFSNIEWIKNSDRLRCDNVIFDVGKTIFSHLREAESVVLYCCSIGPGLETWSSQLIREGDFFKGYMVDIVASKTVELTVEKIQNDLERTQRQKGLEISNCYSPGYCGWHVSDQQKLFSLLPTDFCGIKLTKSSLMLPIKSFSGIIGMGQKMRKFDHVCDLCDMQNCIYRKRSKKTRQEK